MARYLIFFFLFNFSVFAQRTKSTTGVHYSEKIIVPKDGMVTVRYASFYTGMRYDKSNRTWMAGNVATGPVGGCSFSDLTDKDSIITLQDSGGDSVTVKAIPFHILRVRCDWLAPLT